MYPHCQYVTRDIGFISMWSEVLADTNAIVSWERPDALSRQLTVNKLTSFLILFSLLL